MVALVVIHGAPEVLPEASVKLEAFTLGESIGRGAFASVVKARWGESLVAVKRWHVALIASESIRVPLEPDSEAYECFANELRVCSLEGVTEHVNLVRLMGFGYIAPRLGSGIAGFLVMEAAEGVDLRRRLRDARAISFEQCSMWITGLARALSHLHSRGFVHRDVKPSNLMVREEGEAKLVDYGLAVQLFLPAASATASATSATASATSLAADGLHAPSTTREGPLLTRFQADAQVGVYPFHGARGVPQAAVGAAHRRVGHRHDALPGARALPRAAGARRPQGRGLRVRMGMALLLRAGGLLRAKALPARPAPALAERALEGARRVQAPRARGATDGRAARAAAREQLRSLHRRREQWFAAAGPTARGAVRRLGGACAWLLRDEGEWVF